MNFLRLSPEFKVKPHAFLVVILLTMTCAFSQAPPVQWAHNIGLDTQEEVARYIQTDDNNDVYSLGFYRDTVDFNPGTGVDAINCGSSGSWVLVKKNNNGNYVWALSLSVNSNTNNPPVFLIDAGEIVLSGDCSFTTDIDPIGGSGTTVPFNSFFMARYNASTGSLVSVQHTSNVANFKVWDMALDPAGNIVQVGYFIGTQDFDFSANDVELTSQGATADNYIVKYSPSGTLLWAGQIGGLPSSQWTRSISINNNGQIFIAGGFSGTIDIDPDPVSSFLVSAGSLYGGFVVSIDGNGSFAWGKAIQDLDVIHAIQDVVATNTTIFLYGSHSGTTDFSFGSGLGVSSASGDRDAFVSRLTILGTYVTHKTIDGLVGDLIYPGDLKRSNSGLLYLTGTYSGTYDFDPGAGVQNMTSSNYDWYQVCLDNALNYQWKQSMGGASTDFHADMALSKNGNLVLNGNLIGQGDMDPSAGVLLVGNNSNITGNVVDALYGTALPEINVVGNSISIPNNSSIVSVNNLTDFGDLCLFGPDTAHFIVQSTGLDGLLVSGVSVSGPDASDFQVSNIALNILSGGEATLQVIALGNSLGVKNATITISSDDPDESTYKFDIRSSVQELPEVNLTVSPNETVFCAGDLVTFAGSGADTYNWNNGVTDSSPIAISSSGNYQVIGTTIYGCKDTNVVAITVNPLPIVTVTSNVSNDEICLNDTVQLIGAGADNYSYSGGVVDQTDFFPTTTDSYTVTGTDGNGCENTASITITVNPLPTVAVTSNATNDAICLNDAVQLSGSGATTYSYTGGVVDQTDFFPTTTDSYTVTGTDGNGCENTASITITVNPLPDVSVSSSELDDTICVNDSIQLIGAGALNYAYTGGVVDQTNFAPSGTATYYIVGTDANGCQDNDSITIFVEVTPSIDAGNDLFACYGDSVWLDATGAGTITWTGGIVNTSFFVPTMNTQELVASTVTLQGCTNSDTIQVVMGAQIDGALTTSVDTVIAATGYASYVWFDCSNDLVIGSSTQNWIEVGYDGEFYAVITDADGCSDTTECAVINFSSLSENVQLDIQLMPNPTQGMVHIKTSLAVTTINVYDNAGRLVLAQNGSEKEVNLAQLARGNYVIEVQTKTGVFVGRVVKQ